MSEKASWTRKIRWWVFGAIILLGVALVAYVRLSPSVDTAFRNPLAFLAVGLIIALLSVWMLLLSGLRWRTRFIILGVEIAVVLGLRFTVRIEGVYGDLMPQLQWRWAKPADYRLASTPATTAPAGAAIDLKSVSAHDYPRFLGPAGQPVINGVGMSRDWNAKRPREVWRQPIGAGWSAFAIVGDYAVTQEQRGDLEQVTCYEIATGRLRWSHADAGRFYNALSGVGPFATPTIADGRVYAMGATGLLNCLDGATGSVVWSRQALADAQQQNLEWGKSCSPLVFDGKVIVNLGKAPEGPCLAAYDAKSGKLLWQAGRDTASYASPAIATLAGRKQIVSVNAQSVTGHDPEDGRVLWTHPWPGKMARCSQPVIVEKDRVFISAGYGMGSTLLQISIGDDKQLSANEIWHNRNMKTRFTNVAVKDGFVYGLDDGVLACVELATGELKWKIGHYGHGQVLLVDDLLLVTSEAGELLLVDANPAQHRELGRIEALSDKTWNNPATNGRYLLVRNAAEAVCYELQK